MPPSTLPHGAEPLLSIIVPVYNEAGTIAAVLDRLRTVPLPVPREIIVVNDGSTDATADVLASHQAQQGFTVINQSNQGLPNALNAGFARAQGEYLTWTSSDNIMLPDMLQVLASALDQNPSVGLVYADRYFITEEGANLGRFNLPDYDPHLLLHVNTVHCCFLYRRDCMERVGQYDPAFIYGEDWEYWIRISQYYRMKHIPAALYCYRLHKTSMTSDLVRGRARSIGFQEFSARVRRRMPARWYLGKLKWWWIRMTAPQHPAVAERAAWLQAAARIAGQTD